MIILTALLCFYIMKTVERHKGAIPGLRWNAERGFLVLGLSKPECSYVVRHGTVSFVDRYSTRVFFVARKCRNTKEV